MQRDPSLVVDNRSKLGTAPGVHGLLIGISDYRFLAEADDPPGTGLSALPKQDSAALTAFSLMQKMLLLDKEGRLACPLKTLRLLIAPSHAEIDREPSLSGFAGGADCGRIRAALQDWREDLAESEQGQGWFFFSGHAVRRALEEAVLLAADFMDPSGSAMAGSFRLSNVRAGMAPAGDRSEIARTQFYFIDVGGTPVQTLDRLDDTQTPKMFDTSLPTLDDRRAPMYFGTTPMGLPQPAGLTTFGSALLWGLDNGAGDGRVKHKGRNAWPITAFSLKTATEKAGGEGLRTELTGLIGDPVVCFRFEPPPELSSKAAPAGEKPRPRGRAKAASRKGGKARSDAGGGADIPASPPAPSREGVRTQLDDPALVDRLGRKGFARVLATRIREARAAPREDPDNRAFMVHLHGPWGSGKSSVLNFLKGELKSEDPWLIVGFNAWKHQRLRPPWWSLITSIYKAALADPCVGSNWWLRVVWWRWRLRADWLPLALVALVLGLLAFGFVGLIGQGETALKFVAAAVTAAAGVYSYARFLLMGSSKAAQTYAEIRSDPFGPVVDLLNDIVAAIHNPVAVFIDDLDRCDSDYVVELLEGIQTLQRSARITYVVAADRQWIRASIEKKYSDFTDAIGDKGRPLGYLFLDKMFQMSEAIPRFSGTIKAQYWASLLGPEDRSLDDPVAVNEAQARAASDVSDVTDLESLQKIIEDSTGESAARRQALREQAALQITSAAAVEATEHRLQGLAPLLEANPRAMKRLVNAVGMAQAFTLLEGRSVDLDVLARWAMIELRWPILAEYFAKSPAAIAAFIDMAARELSDEDRRLFPPIVTELCQRPEIVAIIGPHGKEGGIDQEALVAWLT